MPLVGGSVSINGAGVASGTGLSKALYDKLETLFGVSPAQVPHNVPGAQQQLAQMAEAIGQVVVDYVVANAELVVDAGIPVTVSGTATTQSGATTAPGSGSLL